MTEKTPKKKSKGFRPKKSLGQHFLRDNSIIQEMINRARFESSDQILEIGGGTGALTLPLAGTVHHILSIEKDRHLAKLLKERVDREGIRNATIICSDILKLDLNRLPWTRGARIHIIGNLPYNISSPLLERLIQNRHLFNRAILMFQFEVGKRLTASPGSRAYGALTVLIQYYAAVSRLIDVPKEAFYPRPKVNSMVLEIDFKRPYPRRAEDEESFKKVVKGAFSHRRKTLLNALRGAFALSSGDEILISLKKCGIDPVKRAETLDMDSFLCLGSAMRPFLDKNITRC